MGTGAAKSPRANFFLAGRNTHVPRSWAVDDGRGGKSPQSVFLSRLSDGISEQWEVPVALRQHRIGQRPFDRNRRIIPTQPARKLRHIKFRHLVEHFRIVRETLKAVSKAAQNIQHPAILTGKLEAFPFAERWRIRADIHGHIEDRPSRATDQLDLRLRFGLKVHAANHAAFFREGEIALRPARCEAMSGELVVAISSSQKTALIFAQFQLNEPKAFE